VARRLTTLHRAATARLRRRRGAATAVLGLAVGLAVAVSLGGLRPGAYWAEQRLAVAAAPVGVGRDDRVISVTLDSEVQVLTSSEVLEPVAQQVRFPGGTEGLREALGVTAVPNTRILVLRVTTPSSPLSRETVQVLASQFLAQRETAAEDRTAAAERVLGRQVQEVSGQLALLRAGRVSDDPLAVAAPLTQERLLAEQLSRLQAEIAAVTAAEGTAGSDVVAERSGAEPRTVLVVSGGMLGMLGGLLVHWSERRGPRRHP
jgi:hypothetical protein